MKLIWVIWISLLILIPIGCAPQKQSESSPKPEQPITINQDKVDTAKTVAEKNRRVDEATAVSINDGLSVGLKVTNFDRFFLKSTRKEVFDNLKKRFPEDEIHVTTDSKLFKDLKKLEGDARKNPAINKEKAYQQLQKINEDMKG